jgi:DNA-binding protein H-NS
MAKQTYAHIQLQIQKLTAEAEKLRLTEVGEVVAKIKEAIAVYGFDSSDLFGISPQGSKRRSAVRSTAKTKSTRGATAKFADGKGGEWVGRGPRPLWLRAALSAGKSLDDFAVGNQKQRPVTTTTTPAVTSAKKGSKSPKKRAASAFKDDAGNTWGGRGPRPAWLKAAIAGGKSLDDLRG